MASYWRQLQAFGRDIKLFLLFNLFAFVGWGVFQLIFNLYLKELNLREDDMGLFASVQTIVVALGAATLGPVIERVGIWRSLTGGLTIFLICSFGLAWAESPPIILALSAISGIGIAYFFTMTMPFIIEWSSRGQRQHVTAIAYAVIGLSGTLGSLIGGLVPNVLPLNDLWSYRWTLMIGALISGLGLIPLFRMGPARRGSAAPDPTAAREAIDDVGRRRVRNDMLIFAIGGSVMALGMGMVVPFANVYLSRLGASSGTIGLTFALAGLGAATIGLFAPVISRRMGALRGAALVRFLGIPLYALLLFFPVLPVAMLAHIMRQTTVSMAWPIDTTFISELLPPKARARVFGYRSAVWNLIWATATLTGGEVIVQFGYPPTFALLIVTGFISILLFLVYYQRHPRVVAGDIPSALSARDRALRETPMENDQEAQPV